MTGLEGSTWRFEQVAGVPVGAVPDRARPELTFELDGQVYGSGGVNHFRGTYHLDGDALSFGPLVSTRRAGTPEHEERELAVLGLLGAPLIARSDPDDQDLLELIGPDGRTSVLVRVV